MRTARLALSLMLPLGVVLAACTNGDKDDTDDTDNVNDDTGGSTGGDEIDQDGDGFTEDEDCDDLDADVNPDASETCDGVDNDCDGEIDEGVMDTYYDDADGDGFGDPSSSVDACEALTGTVPNSNDCDDSDSTIYPGAEELCDGIDNNCDGVVDEDLTSQSWYADSDGDGYGDADDSVEACEQPTGYVDNDWDCDDGDSGEPVHVSGDGTTWSKKFAPAPDTASDTAWETGGTGAPASGAGTVDDPFAYIQEGINAADVCVFVFDGTYNEDINFNGKDITVTGVDGADNTTIQGTGSAPVVTFESGESSNAVLDGFTITGGMGDVQVDTQTSNCFSTYTCTTTTYTYRGGGIFAKDSSPTLQNLIVDSNTLPDYSYTEVSQVEFTYIYSFGGGGYFENSSSVLDSIWWVGNSADVGGGIYADDDSAISAKHNGFIQNSAATGGGSTTAGSFTATNSIWSHNTSNEDGSSYGGAGHDSVDGLFSATNITMAGNDGMAGAYIGATATGSIVNSILVENDSGASIDGASGSSVSLSYSNVYNSLGDSYGSGVSDATGTDGNISDDPLFTAWSDDGDFSDDDLTLGSGSPAIDAGSTVSAYDDADGTRNDMGAYGGPQGEW